MSFSSEETHPELNPDIDFAVGRREESAVYATRKVAEKIPYNATSS